MNRRDCLIATSVGGRTGAGAACVGGAVRRDAERDERRSGQISGRVESAALDARGRRARRRRADRELSAHAEGRRRRLLASERRRLRLVRSDADAARQVLGPHRSDLDCARDPAGERAGQDRARRRLAIGARPARRRQRRACDRQSARVQAAGTANRQHRLQQLERLRRRLPGSGSAADAARREVRRRDPQAAHAARRVRSHRRTDVPRRPANLEGCTGDLLAQQRTRDHRQSAQHLRQAHRSHRRAPAA